MKIIKKDCWGFWFFKRYSFYLEDEEESITELIVSKEEWDGFDVDDYFDPQYKKLFKTTKSWWIR